MPSLRSFRRRPDAKNQARHPCSEAAGNARCRKPVACVEACDKAGIVLAVNQNMRFDQSVRAMKDILNRGWLGEPVLATIDMRAIPHWMPWSQQLHSLATFVMSIHHLDTFRYWFGTPDRVLASTRPDPRTKFSHSDGINLYILEYESGLRCASCDDVWTGPAREGSERRYRHSLARVEGTDGLARGIASVGPVTQSAFPAPSTSRPYGGRHTGSSRAGPRSGSRTRLSGRWRSCSSLSKKGPNPKSAGATTSGPLRFAKRSLRRRAITVWLK